MAQVFRLVHPQDRIEKAGRKAKSPGAFRSDITGQLDPFVGSAQFRVPQNHLARKVLAFVEGLDLGEAGKVRSGLGRRAFDPRRLLALLIYGTLVAIPNIRRLADQLVTDMALRFLSGGHSVSASTLRTFQRTQGKLIEKVFDQTIRIAVEEGFVDPTQLAVDGMRLRAAASPKAVRTKTRSTQRLEELRKVDVSTLTEEQALAHAAKVAKHEKALEEMAEKESTSVVVTNSLASLMKFPNGGAAPGHRLVVTAAGQSERIAVGLTISDASTDKGELGAALDDASKRLERAGVPKGTKLRVAADAGFLGEEDQKYIVSQRDRIDVVIPPPVEGVRRNGGVEMFTRANFTRNEEGQVLCPAGTAMTRVNDAGSSVEKWRGVGCADCKLRERCTTSKTARSFEVDLEALARHEALRRRYEEPGARDFYKQRMSTVEPVFSTTEDEMGFRRVLSNKPETVKAQTFLTYAAYNFLRLTLLRQRKAAATSPVRRSYRSLAASRAHALRRARKAA